MEEKSTMGHDEGIMPCTYNYPINITDKDCSTETMIDIGHFSIIVTDGKCNEIVDATKDELRVTQGKMWLLIFCSYTS